MKLNRISPFLNITTILTTINTQENDIKADDNPLTVSKRISFSEVIDCSNNKNHTKFQGLFNNFSSQSSISSLEYEDSMCNSLLEDASGSEFEDSMSKPLLDDISGLSSGYEESMCNSLLEDDPDSEFEDSMSKPLLDDASGLSSEYEDSTDRPEINDDSEIFKYQLLNDKTKIEQHDFQEKEIPISNPKT